MLIGSSSLSTYLYTYKSSTGSASVDSLSVLSAVDINTGSITGSVLTNVTALSAEAEGAVLVNVTAKR